MIDNLKRIVKFFGDITAELADALADGKIQWTELLNFINEIAQVPAIVKSFPELLEEVNNLTPELRAELEAYVKQQINLPSDKTTFFVENALMFTVSLVAVVNARKEAAALPSEEETPTT